MTHAAPSNDSWASACRGFRCLSGYRGPLTTRYRDIRALLIWAENAGRAAALAVAFLVSVHQDDIKGFRPHFDREVEIPGFQQGVGTGFLEEHVDTATTADDIVVGTAVERILESRTNQQVIACTAR